MAEEQVCSDEERQILSLESLKLLKTIATPLLKDVDLSAVQRILTAIDKEISNIEHWEEQG